MMDNFGKNARKKCSECGSTKLAWMTVFELLWSVSADERDWYRRLLPLTGAGAEAWKCSSCDDGHGVFAPQDFRLA